MQCRYRTQMPGARDAGGRGERQVNVARQTFSRCQVICAECEAWNQGEGPGTSTFFFDGISFWRRVPNGKERPHGDGEAAWINRPGAMRIFRHLWDGLCVAAFSEENARQPGTSAKIARVHPTQKPIALMRWCIEFLPADTDLILDPFMGSGTTLVACQRMGRHGTGIELDPDYFDTACRRVDEAARQPDLLIPETRPQPVQEQLL